MIRTLRTERYMTAAIPDSHRDLLAAPGVGVLSTIGPDGRPQSTAIWFLLDGEVIRTSLHRSRQKYRNMLATPRATLFVFDPASAYRTIEVRSDVTAADDGDLSFLTRLLSHYGGDLATFAAPVDDRAVVTFTPARVVTNG
jgi:PPOX class probable F420-dependent enzyme